MTPRLRVVVADDERPARAFLMSALRSFDDVEIVGEAASGPEAVHVIERTKPDVALLDLQMPEVDGLGVVRLLRKKRVPLVIFVTAHDEYAVSAFELHAVDYLLKPVNKARLREALNRAHERLEQADAGREHRNSVATLATETLGPPQYLERIPIRHRDEIYILPVSQIAAVVADAELLHITTVRNEKHTINYRLKDIEQRLDPAKFIRLSRGILANLSLIQKVTPMPGGTHLVTLSSGQRLPVSRSHSRVLRQHLLKL